MNYNNDLQVIKEFCDYITKLNVKVYQNPDIFCCTSNNTKYIYEIDIKRYFSSLIYCLTENMYYLSLSKDKYLEIAKEINKSGITLTKSTSIFANIVFSSFCRKENLILAYRDTIDSAIILSNKEYDPIVSYKSNIAGWKITLDIKFTPLTLVYFNKFRGIFFKMYRDKTIKSNIEIKATADEILTLVKNKNLSVNDSNLSLLILLLRSCK